MFWTQIFSAASLRGNHHVPVWFTSQPARRFQEVFGCAVEKPSCKSARSGTLLAFSERYSSTARTETDDLIRRLHPPSRGRHTGLDLIRERERETRSVPRSVQTVVERRWENTSESPLEHWITWSCSGRDYVKKNSAKKAPELRNEAAAEKVSLHYTSVRCWRFTPITQMSFRCRCSNLLHQSVQRKLDSSPCYPSVLTDQRTAGL